MASGGPEVATAAFFRIAAGFGASSQTNAWAAAWRPPPRINGELGARGLGPPHDLITLRGIANVKLNARLISTSPEFEAGRFRRFASGTSPDKAVPV